MPSAAAPPFPGPSPSSAHATNDGPLPALFMGFRGRFLSPGSPLPRGQIHVVEVGGIYSFFFFCLFVFLPFLGPLLWHMGVPRLGV